MKSGLSALAAVVLWASLAALATLLPNIPPFLKTGIGLLVGSLMALPLAKFDLKKLRVSWRTLALGVYGLFGYHAALFIALQTAALNQCLLEFFLLCMDLFLIPPILFLHYLHL